MRLLQQCQWFGSRLAKIHSNKNTVYCIAVCPAWRLEEDNETAIQINSYVDEAEYRRVWTERTWVQNFSRITRYVMEMCKKMYSGHSRSGPSKSCLSEEHIAWTHPVNSTLEICWQVLVTYDTSPATDFLVSSTALGPQGLAVTCKRWKRYELGAGAVSRCWEKIWVVS
jgi:hypothetical protein